MLDPCRWIASQSGFTVGNHSLTCCWLGNGGGDLFHHHFITEENGGGNLSFNQGIINDPLASRTEPFRQSVEMVLMVRSSTLGSFGSKAGPGLPCLAHGPMVFNFYNFIVYGLISMIQLRLVACFRAVHQTCSSKASMFHFRLVCQANCRPVQSRDQTGTQNT